MLWLQANGFPYADIVARGSAKGDIKNVPNWTLEAKNEKTARFSGYVTQLEAEMERTSTPYGAIVVHRRGRAGVDDAYVFMTGRIFKRILQALGE